MKKTLKVNKTQVADGGDFVAATLGLLQTGEAVQTSMFDVDVEASYSRNMVKIYDRKYPRKEQVYILQEVGPEGYIKIGYSNQFARRLNTLQANNAREMRLLALLDGNRDLESELHERFKEHRIKGDWFTPHPDILEFAKQSAQKS